MTPFYANYHTHTFRCGHAKGTDEEIVQAAIAAGFKILGFADHGPHANYRGDADDFSGNRENVEDYFRSLSELRERYRNQIEIHIGYEVEYVPESFPSLMEFLQDYPYEYLIMGEHSITHGGPYMGMPIGDPAMLERYVSCVLEGLDTGKYLYLAHPDLPHWTGDVAIMETQWRRLCEGCYDRKIPLEVNMLGFREKRCYPSEAFFRIAQETGNTLIRGVDAHRPEHFTEPGVIEPFCAWAEQFGLPMLETLPL